MAKTIKNDTINIFNDQIYNKGVEAKKVRQKYNQLTERIKQLNSKITHHQKEDNFAEATKLKRLQSDLEQELVDVDAQLNTDDYKVTDEEFKAFYEAYNEEMSEFKAEHQKLKKEMLEKLKEIKKVYRKMIENKNEAGRRISRERYVNQEKNNPGNIHNQFKGQMLDHEINLGDGDKYDEQTTPRGYAWKLEKALEAVSRDEFQKYYYGHKHW